MGVTYQPTFNLVGFDFHMELQAQTVISEREGLVLGDLGRSQASGASGQVESIPMPVQDLEVAGAQRFQA